MSKPTEEKLQEMESKLNTAIGMLMVPAMTSGIKEVKDAHQAIIDFAGDFTDLINDYLV